MKTSRAAALVLLLAALPVQAVTSTLPAQTAKTAMTQAQANLPLFYRELVAFDQATHGQLAFPAQPADFNYAKATNIIPLLIQETGLALKSYPLVFLPGNDKTPPTLAAMVGIGDNINRFVDNAGQWRADTYIPAWVRRYPFLAVTPAGSKDAVLALDPSAELLKQTGGEPLMKNGEPSERLKGIIAFNQEFTAIAERTNAIVSALQEAGVLEEGSLRFAPPGTPPEQAQEINGFLIVSEQKLRALSDEAVLKLHKADAFGLAYAQMLSMNNLDNLLAQPVAAVPPAPTSGKKTNTSKSNVH
jgi:hypothetical protein